MDGRVAKWVDGLMGGWIDGWVDWWMDEWMRCWMNGCIQQWIHNHAQAGIQTGECMRITTNDMNYIYRYTNKQMIWFDLNFQRHFMPSRANRRPVLPNYSTLGSWHYWQVNQYASSPLFRKLLATFPLESAEGDKWPSEKFVGQISRKASRPGWGLNPRPLASQPSDLDRSATEAGFIFNKLCLCTSANIMLHYTHD